MTLTATFKELLTKELEIIMEEYEAFRAQLANFGQNGGDIKPALEEEAVWEAKIKSTKQAMRGKVVRPERQNRIIALGSPVTLFYPDGKKQKLIIDGNGFKNDQLMVISQKSPIGALLMGKKQNETIAIDGQKIKIQRIDFPW